MATSAKKKSASKASAASRGVRPGREAAAEVDEMEDETEAEAIERTPFDYDAYFKEAGLEYTEADLLDVGGLMPIYASEHAFEDEWPPLFGLLVNRIEIKVAKQEEDPKKQWRWFYVVEAEIATKALSGTGDDRDTIDIEPGDYVLMPESGALKNRDRLKMAAVDPDQVHRVFFRVEGEPVDLGKPGRNPMWPIESKLIGDPIPRRGRYVIANTAREGSDAPALPEAQNGQNGRALSPGTVLNKRTGAAQGSLIGS